MIIEKYNKRAEKINSLLCVGLDSDFEKLPEKFKSLEFPQFEFNKWIIEETNEYVSAYKPNSAFYEARGYQGMKELKMTIDYLNKNYPDIFTIVDIKRGDIGNTNEAYARAYYDFFGFDAVTMHAYMGKEPLKYFLDRKDKICIILCRTSNPGAREIQDLLIDHKPLWQVIAEKVRDDWNYNKNCMLVIGAPYPAELKKVRGIMGDMTFLIPGIGPQGGDLKAVLEAGLNSQGLGLIINSSRGIIFAENPKAEARKLCEEIRKHKGI